MSSSDNARRGWATLLSGASAPAPTLGDIFRNLPAKATLLGGSPTPEPSLGDLLRNWPAAPPPPSLGDLFGLARAPIPVPTPTVWGWIYVRRRFQTLLSNLAHTGAQAAEGATKHAGVRACLNRHYYGYSSDDANSMLVGSWGRDTQVRPPRDIDVLYLLPPSVYHRYQARGGNRQSDLLQEMKDVLLATYPQTRMRGDGQVVVVPFNTIPIEVVPGFRCQDGSIIICDTHDGGSYRTSTAEAEAAQLSSSDFAWHGNTRALVRMMKCWQVERNVPLESFKFERLAIDFLAVWPFSHHDVFWYDWMARDFFAFLIGRANSYVYMPQGGGPIFLGDEWVTRAQTAYRNAVEACDHEYNNREAAAGASWQAIFGIAVPSSVL